MKYNLRKNSISEIIEKNTRILEKKYLMNFMDALLLSKMGQNNISKKIIKNNKRLEKELGKLYFADSIDKNKLGNYLFSKKFLGPEFNIYRPFKVNLGTRILIKEDKIGLIQEIVSFKRDKNVIERFESLEKIIKKYSKFMFLGGKS